jgi:hypothetical protein
MRADGRTDMTKLTVGFRNFAKAPNKTYEKPEAVSFFWFQNRTYFFHDICKLTHTSGNGRMAKDIAP